MQWASPPVEDPPCTASSFAFTSGDSPNPNPMPTRATKQPLMKLDIAKSPERNRNSPSESHTPSDHVIDQHRIRRTAQSNLEKTRSTSIHDSPFFPDGLSILVPGWKPTDASGPLRARASVSFVSPSAGLRSEWGPARNARTFWLASATYAYRR